MRRSAIDLLLQLGAPEASTDAKAGRRFCSLSVSRKRQLVISSARVSASSMAMSARSWSSSSGLPACV